MRRIMGSSFITLGGVMQARGGPELWTDTFSKAHYGINTAVIVKRQ